MKLFLTLAGLLVALLVSWLYFAAPSSRALTGTAIYVPLVMKQGWMEGEVAIVQRDGHQAVYWPSPVASPYWPIPTPTPGTPVPTIPIYLEVENHTSRNVSEVNVEFQAFDSSGSPITQTVTRAATLIEILRPGQRSPVALNVPFPGGYQAFRAASKGFTVLPDWSFTDWNTQEGLEVSWSPPWPISYPPPPYPTPTPTVLLPNVRGWVKNTTTVPAYGVTVVVTVRGNDQAWGLVLEATKVPLYSMIYPGAYESFYANLARDYGPLFAGLEAVAQRRLDIPGILERTSW